jgi:hypothetical protein
MTKKFRTELEVEEFVKTLIEGTYGCTLEDHPEQLPLGSNCCTNPCREAYGKSKPEDVNWILESFRAGENYVECG